MVLVPSYNTRTPGRGRGKAVPHVSRVNYLDPEVGPLGPREGERVLQGRHHRDRNRGPGAIHDDLRAHDLEADFGHALDLRPGYINEEEVTREGGKDFISAGWVDITSRSDGRGIDRGFG